MLSFYQKYGRTIFDILLIVVTVYLFMYLFSSFYNVAKPVIFALVIYLLVEPFAKFLHRKGIKKVVATTLSMIFFVIILLLIIILLGAIIVNQVIDLADNLPKYIEFLQVEVVSWFNIISEEIGGISPDLIQTITESLTGIATNLAVYLQDFFLALVESVTSFSSLVVNFVLGIILAFFLSLEINDWERFAKEKVPKTFRNAYVFLKENVIKGIVIYLKSQMKLISITFILVLIGLFLIGIDSAITIALIAAVLDLIPLLGISVLFIPWIVYQLIVGSYSTAIFLSIVYVVVAVVRQLLEPKITGQSLGVSAFTMLAVALISLSIFGVAGVILSPILLILIKALIDQGYLKRWIHIPEGEFDE